MGRWTRCIDFCFWSSGLVFLGWANWSGDFLVDTKMKPSEVILLALNLFLFSWKCIQFNGSFPSLNLLDWLDLLSTPGFIWIDPILTDSFIHYMILGTILNSWTWIHCMLREFRYLTTMQEDVSVGSLVALNFSQICLDHIAIITRQIAGCRRPSWCRPACTSARLNPRFFTRGSAWYFPQEGTNLRRRPYWATITVLHHLQEKIERKSRGRNKTAGSQFHLVALWHSFARIYDVGRFSAFDFPDFTKKGDQGTFTGTTIEWTFCANTSIVKVFGLLQHSHGIFIPGITAEHWWHQFSCLWLQVSMWILSLCKSQIRYRTLYIVFNPHKGSFAHFLFHRDSTKKTNFKRSSNEIWSGPSFPPSHLVVATAYRIVELGQGHIILVAMEMEGWNCHDCTLGCTPCQKEKNVLQHKITSPHPPLA